MMLASLGEVRVTSQLMISETLLPISSPQFTIYRDFVCLSQLYVATYVAVARLPNLQCLLATLAAN